MPDRFVALLRGVNVGGKNKLSMVTLAAIFSDAGCLDVATYIQSGNVVFTASPEVAIGLPGRIATRIANDLGIKVPVLIRSAEELASAIDGNPLIARGLPADTLHVLFLDDLPTPDRVAALDPARSPPDSFVVVGREVFLHLPDGVARSKLTNAYFDGKLATTSSSRNWRTVLKLSEMLGAPSGR